MSLISAIGRTPLVRLSSIVPSNSADAWVKYEGNNPTGSYKDRKAFGVIRKALDRGDLKVGDRICECKGGSTGTSIADVSSTFGLKFTLVMSKAFASSKIHAIRTYGAGALIVESSDGKLNPDLCDGVKDAVRELVQTEGIYYFYQLGSPDVQPSHAALGDELAEGMARKIEV